MLGRARRSLTTGRGESIRKRVYTVGAEIKATSGPGTFFRHCPNCGKRFHIKLVSKKLVSDRKERRVRKELAEGTDIMVGNRFQNPNPQVLYVDVPVEMEVENFDYSYRCAHCGHAWTEAHAKEFDIS